MNNEATREVFWNVSHPLNAVVMYALFALSLVVFLNALYRRYKFWRSGQTRLYPGFPSVGQLAKGLCVVLSQRRVSRKKPAGSYHMAVYLGFLSLLAITTAVFLDYDLGIPIFKGTPYLVLTFLADVLGAAFLFALLLFLKRRLQGNNEYLSTTGADIFFIGALLVLLVQGFLLEALRIATIPDPWALWSPVGLVLSKMFWAFSDESKEIIHFGMWWFHAVTFFVLLAITPYTKAFHIIASSLCLASSSRASLGYEGDVQKLMEEAMEGDADDIRLGVKTLADTTWRQRLEFDGCTACGRCQEVCPAWLSGKVLSPKLLMVGMKRYSDLIEQSGFDGALRSSLTPRPAKKDEREDAYFKDVAELDFNESNICGDLIDEEVFWSCTTCRACVEACPVGINHVDFIIDVRKAQTMLEAATPREGASMLRTLEAKGSPFVSSDEREGWMEGLDVKIIQPGEKVDILYWVGCISNSDKRKQNIVRSVAKILNASGVNWATLGKSECCTGDPARRLGDELQFQSFCNSNVETFSKLDFGRILVNCPHCLNSLAGDYSPFCNYEVVHHTAYIRELVDSGKLKLEEKYHEAVTYHDPCYLARYSGVRSEPRESLVQIGARNREMETAMCCGAGGGHFWMDIKKGERVNVLRIEQALKTEVSTVVSSCPFCIHMLEDATKLVSEAEGIQVKDIAEIVAETFVDPN